MTTHETEPLTHLVPTQAPVAAPPALNAYYSEAGPDYAAWSPGYNMHFGYYRRGMNPFHREPMLENMNTEILNRLHLPTNIPTNILDMGCGVGATLRSLAPRVPQASLTGITIVPCQIERAHSTQPDRSWPRPHPPGPGRLRTHRIRTRHLRRRLRPRKLLPRPRP